MASPPEHAERNANDSIKGTYWQLPVYLEQYQAT